MQLRSLRPEALERAVGLSAAVLHRDFLKKECEVGEMTRYSVVTLNGVTEMLLVLFGSFAQGSLRLSPPRELL